LTGKGLMCYNPSFCLEAEWVVLHALMCEVMWAHDILKPFAGDARSNNKNPVADIIEKFEVRACRRNGDRVDYQNC
jgi:hypothetical protein